MPTISVIVPVYKVEPYLDRCVKSILAQTYTDFELILVDDGSPDNCPAMCDAWAEKDSRIVVIHQANGGLSAARNAGIDWAFQHSDSVWLTFIDSDDWVHPQCLAKLLDAAEQNGVAVSVCGYAETTGEEPAVDTETTATLWTPKDFFVKQNTNAVIACGKLYRKDRFAEIRYPVGKIHEDEFVTYKILFTASKIAYIEAPLYAYYQNPNSITHSRWSEKRLDVLEALEERVRFFEERTDADMIAYSRYQLRSRIAWLNLQAYKAHRHQCFPRQYALSFFKAARELEAAEGTDRYEWMMSQMFLGFVNVQAKYRKAVSLLLKRDMKKDRMS